jgi:predicted nuclease of restriction endonuclease-like (RecB) superfamily
MSKVITVDSEYKEWIQDVGQRFKRSQIKTAIKVNDEMLRFYWSLGKDISEKGMEAKYGSGFYKMLSKDLTELMPDIRSFSVTNLKYMRYFYETFPDAQNRPQLVDDLDTIFMIPWGHYRYILNKCLDNQDKALFYVRKTLENGWSRAMLLNFLDTDLYERQGKAITNFDMTLPERDSDLAQEITKDPYNFDFLTLTDRYNEKEMKDALMDNAEKFFLELGQGFSYIGREVRIMVGKKEKFMDMLFFNYITRCFVVLEIKAGDFESPNTGQLGTYVVAVNHQMKEEWMNPTIGLLICKDKDEIEAQYALESSSQPLGISSYELSNLIPDNYKGSMPTIEEIEAELAD